jgi:hypothetical protein
VTTTVIDVLDRVLGSEHSVERVNEMTLDEVEELADAVERHYHGWQAPPGDELRVHLGGWVGGNFAAAEARQLLATMLLYADQVVLHDPLAEWFYSGRHRLRALDPIRFRNGTKLAGSEGHLLRSDGWPAHRGELEPNLATLRWAIPALRDIAPLVNSGAAVLVPHLQLLAGLQDPLFTAIRHDLADDRFLQAVENPIDLQPVTTDFSRGIRLDIKNAGGFVSDKDRRLQIAGNPSYYLNKTLAISSATRATYLPPSATDWALYEFKIAAASEEFRRATKTDLQVLAALHTSDLPLISHLALDTVAALRLKEGVMEEWRVALRQAARGLTTIPVEGASFAADSRQVLADLLSPAERQVAKEAGLLGRFQRGGRDASIKLVSGAAGAGATAAIIGGPPAGLITAGVSAVTGWTLAALLPPRHTGVANVVAHITQSNM